MEAYLKIPVTFTRKSGYFTFERTKDVQDSIRQFMELLISTHQGECSHDHDFGYSVWSNEFEPILNSMQWQPRFMEQVRYMLEKYEPRISDVYVREPKFELIDRKNKMQWQPRFMEQVRYMLEKYEPRITDVHVREPKFELIDRKNKTDRDYKITLNIDYWIESTKEQQKNIEITFEY